MSGGAVEERPPAVRHVRRSDPVVDQSFPVCRVREIGVAGSGLEPWGQVLRMASGPGRRASGARRRRRPPVLRRVRQPGVEEEVDDRDHVVGDRRHGSGPPRRTVSPAARRSGAAHRSAGGSTASPPVAAGGPAVISNGSRMAEPASSRPPSAVTPHPRCSREAPSRARTSSGVPAPLVFSPVSPRPSISGRSVRRSSRASMLACLRSPRGLATNTASSATGRRCGRRGRRAGRRSE